MKLKEWIEYKLNRNEISDYELPEGYFLKAAQLLAAGVSAYNNKFLSSVQSTLKIFYDEDMKTGKWDNKVVGHSEFWGP